MKQRGSTITATANMNISREKWNINHQSVHLHPFELLLIAKGLSLRRKKKIIIYQITDDEIFPTYYFSFNQPYLICSN